MTVGGTGHQDLPSSVRRYVRDRVAQELYTGKFSAGYTCLAAGTDQIFAQELLNSGAELRAVIPSRDYEKSFSGGDLLTYRKLIVRAKLVVNCSFERGAEEAYWQAGKVVVDSCDCLVAIWDGQISRGLGGTADVVRYAEQLGKFVRIIWPPGVRRS